MRVDLVRRLFANEAPTAVSSRQTTMSSTDIFNRTPTVSEDTLEYTLYPPPGSTDQSSATGLAALIESLVQTSLPNFIWHRDSFELKVVQAQEGKDDEWMLEGRMRVGDCVDDEWCAVWLLREISTRWDIAVRYQCIRFLQSPRINH